MIGWKQRAGSQYSFGRAINNGHRIIPLWSDGRQAEGRLEGGEEQWNRQRCRILVPFAAQRRHWIISLFIHGTDMPIYRRNVVYRFHEALSTLHNAFLILFRARITNCLRIKYTERINNRGFDVGGLGNSITLKPRNRAAAKVGNVLVSCRSPPSPDPVF